MLGFRMARSQARRSSIRPAGSHRVSRAAARPVDGVAGGQGGPEERLGTSQVPIWIF